MENYNTIEYKWEHGIYQLDDLVEMVQNGFINEKEFFNITRYNYNQIEKIVCDLNCQS